VRLVLETTLVVLVVVAVPRQFSRSMQLFRLSQAVAEVAVALLTVKRTVVAQLVTLQTAQQQMAATEPVKAAVAVAV
jgi:hypothetical protein